MPDLFLELRYPSVEETLQNNASLRYKQKRLFLADLRTLMGTLGSAVIGILYLRDVSALIFCLRAIVQFLLSNPYAHHWQYESLLQEVAREQQRWFLFWSVVLVNSISFLCHLFFGAYASSSASDQQLHGGLTLQFLGERLPRGKHELVMFDCLLAVLQTLYFCLMCTTEDLDVLHGRVTEIESIDERVLLDIVSDGFDGNVDLLTLDIWEGIRALWRYDSHADSSEALNLRSVRERALRRMLV